MQNNKPYVVRIMPSIPSTNPPPGFNISTPSRLPPGLKLPQDLRDQLLDSTSSIWNDLFVGMYLSDIFDEVVTPIYYAKQGALIFDNSIIESKLGEGSFGTVIKIYNVVNGNYYAIKILRKSMVRRGDVINEINILGQLKPHCNKYILCIECAFESANFYLIVTELLDNFISLRDYIDDRHNIDYDNNQIIIKELIMGLRVLHNKVCHRDIKPDNIMVDINGNIKYIDFGLSCDINCRSKVGSPIYTAPEILIMSGLNLNSAQCIKGDYWALGMTIYELEMTNNFIADEINDNRSVLKGSSEIGILKFLLKRYTAQGVPWAKYLDSPSIYTPYVLTKLLHADPEKRDLPIVSNRC